MRQSLATDRPIRWRRVNQLPDFVYFNHAIHLRGGIGCETCHGRVDRMAEVKQAAPLTMAWCVDCHRDPVKHLRPASELTTMGYDRKSSPGFTSSIKAAPTNCSTCHR